MAFTAKREKRIGVIDEHGKFAPNEFYLGSHDQLPSWPRDAAQLLYDPAEKALYCEVDVPGPVVTESLDFLPLQLLDNQGRRAEGGFSIVYRPSAGDGKANVGSVALVLQNGDAQIDVAQASMPRVISRGDLQLSSFDNAQGAYAHDADYRTEAGQHAPSVTITLRGAFSPSINSDGKELVYDGRLSPAEKVSSAQIVIDGDFDDWRNVTGVDDVRGDLVSYLDYVPDVDLLECKVAHDEGHLYLYARVAGQVGRTHADGGRSYFYAYLDVDRSAGTGFIPSRDDECYYGVDLGDDCEVQFEFVGNRFHKSFYGFCGLGGDGNVLKQEVALGASQYGRFDAQGVERANYKSEYVYRGGVTEITEDLKPGTSDSIHVAISPDGREVEVSSTFDGFLKDRDGKPTVSLGQAIDLAVGMESDSKVYPGKTRWGADSTPILRGYVLTAPAASKSH